ncbi:MAG: aldo/keto reductase [Candidatus Delongbacteria bacterium]
MKQWNGLATPAGTRRWCGTRLPAQAWSTQAGLSVAGLGWGTLPGELKNIVDSKIERALVQVLAGGLNVLDTSPAYRHRRSQAAVGQALGRELARGALAREELVVSTHAGWLSFNRQEEDPATVLARDVTAATGLGAADFVGGVWSLRPAWLRHQLELSTRLCGLESFDLLFLDAPETGLKVWPRERWRTELREAFVACEELVAEGRLGGYGVASLEGFRCDAQGRARLEADELLQLAREAAGGEPALRALQLPYSLAALDVLNLTVAGQPWLEYAAAQGLWVQTVLGLGQGQLAQGLPGYLRELMPGLSSAQAALQVVRSTPGVGTVLVGMKTREHVAENLALLGDPPLSQADWQRLFQAGE